MRRVKIWYAAGRSYDYDIDGKCTNPDGRFWETSMGDISYPFAPCSATSAYSLARAADLVVGKDRCGRIFIFKDRYGTAHVITHGAKYLDSEDVSNLVNELRRIHSEESSVQLRKKTG